MRSGPRALLLALAGALGLLPTPDAARAQAVLAMVPLPGGAQSIELNAATNRFYVAVAGLNQLIAIDGATNAIHGLSLHEERLGSETLVRSRVSHLVVLR